MQSTGSGITSYLEIGQSVAICVAIGYSECNYTDMEKVASIQHHCRRKAERVM